MYKGNNLVHPSIQYLWGLSNSNCVKLDFTWKIFIHSFFYWYINGDDDDDDDDDFAKKVGGFAVSSQDLRTKQGSPLKLGRS